jgi:hypothetical protein
MRTKWLNKIKNVFYECVLEFNLASINGLAGSIFSTKSQNRCPYRVICIPCDFPVDL